MITALLALLCSPVLAQAVDDGDDESQALGADLPPMVLVEEETSTPMVFVEPEGPSEEEVIVARGAKALGMPEPFIARCRAGLRLIYLRQYDETVAHFKKLEADGYDQLGIGEVAEVLVWQARMFENYDYRYDAEYRDASERAKAELQAAMKVPGNEPWEQFLYAGTVGLEAIHVVRQGSYLPALNKAIEAIQAIQRVKELAPDFVDARLGDGMYNYWRTVVTMSSKVLPSFGDKRAEGIAQIQEVESQGIFLSEPATLALAFSWMEEKDPDKALASTARNRAAYPRNIINNSMHANILLSMRKHKRTLAMYDLVLEEDPSNMRAHYYRGVALMRMGELEQSKAELDRYQSYPYLQDYQQAAVEFRLGQLAERHKDWDLAESHYKTALKHYAHKGAKTRLPIVRESKRKSE